MVMPFVIGFEKLGFICYSSFTDFVVLSGVLGRAIERVKGAILWCYCFVYFIDLTIFRVRLIFGTVTNSVTLVHYGRRRFMAESSLVIASWWSFSSENVIF
jgi:hypothetical protein